MANKKASLKSVRQTEKRVARNRGVMNRLRTQLKKVLLLAKQGGGGVREAAIEYVSYLDKAAKVGVIHHNKVARHKSMMAKFVF
jgi:ribosomal protein S20